MLASLSIANYALIDELSVSFTKGLTILTGETGAGKSIIIDALGLLLGDRASTDQVRSGASKAVVEGRFSNADAGPINRFLEQNELEPMPELILRREISARGTSRCFINDTPVSLAVLRSIGDILVDLHGQHEHQSLLNVRTHCEFLDSYGDLEQEVARYTEAYDGLCRLVRKYDDIVRKSADLDGKRELYKFQAREIDAITPRVGEEEELEQEIRVLGNREKIAAITTDLADLLNDGEGAVSDLLAAVKERLDTLSGIDRSFESSVAEVEAARAIVGELVRSLADYASGLEFDPDRIEEVRNRSGQLAMLRKKYGGSIEAVLAYRQEIAEHLDLTDSMEETLSDIRSEIAGRRNDCAAIASVLHEGRCSAGVKAGREVPAMLQTLGLEKSRFVVSVQPAGGSREDRRSRDDEYQASIDGRTVLLRENGFDTVEFLISTNIGEDPKPLVKVASGGEISRVMLALKSILAKKDRLPVVVFDEIDSGVSGKVARAVGQNLKKLSRSVQVIAITHLPQIAALGDQHFSVQKSEQDGRTQATIRNLGAEERVEEIARLLSGKKVTEVSLMGARELIGG